MDEHQHQAFYELTVNIPKLTQITRKISYLRKLWNIHGQLVKRTGVVVDPSSGQTDMMQTWWSDRIVKPLPFKDLLDQVFSEHDVDQDELYLPHMHGVQLQQVQPVSDVDGITMSQMQETQTGETIVDLTNDQGCNRSIRSMSSHCLPRRKTSFETHVESRFQSVIDTRQEVLEELGSRKIQKITYGDATSLLKGYQLNSSVYFGTSYPRITFPWNSNLNEDELMELMLLEEEEFLQRYMHPILE
ncbi:unnamed protein product [Eruca vesicaria subsp. sativa]|uniref:Uncharacterized protein n=1 Tax=Eruca vesicaria subsp. sativa TaxID=29727 RepID=A0ABC8IVA8_ERUVS|nr:unnamed protein product [Eruca vesicaria subsp. sativa]